MSIEDVLKAVQGMNEKFDTLRGDVDSLMSSRRDRSRSPLRESPASVRRTDTGRPVVYAGAARRDLDWGERDPSETMDFGVPVVFSDEEDESGRGARSAGGSLGGDWQTTKGCVHTECAQRDEEASAE